MRLKIRLDAIVIHNFRLFKDIKVVFDPELTVFISQNGGGKTALLDCVARSLKFLASDLVHGPSYVFAKKEWGLNEEIFHNFGGSNIKFGEDEGEVVTFLDWVIVEKLSNTKSPNLFDEFDKKIPSREGIGNFIDDYLNLHKENPHNGTKENEKLKEEEKNLILKTYPDFTEYQEGINGRSLMALNWKFSKILTAQPSTPLIPLNSISRFYPSGILRRVKGSNEGSSAPILAFYRSENTVYSADQHPYTIYEDVYLLPLYNNSLSGIPPQYSDFFDWYKWQDDQEVRSKQENKTLQAVKNAIFEMFNEEGEAPKFQRMFLDTSEFQNYRLIIEKDGNHLEVGQLSSGEKRLFAIIGDIARRLSLANPGNDNPLKQGHGIVLIDEIDLHLHPKWERKVVPTLRKIFPKVQFIITTHSPLVLQNVPSKSVYILNDGKIYSSQETLGREVGDILEKNMETEPNPHQTKIDELYTLIALEQYNEAKELIDKLSQKIEGKSPDLEKAKSTIRRMETVNK